MVIYKTWLLKTVLGFFMVPYLLYALTWGDVTAYRAFQVVWLVFLFLAVYVRLNKSNHSSSFHALTMTAVLLLSTFSVVISDLSTLGGIDADLLMKTAMFVAIVLLIDRFRGIGFEAFMAYSLPAAISIVIAAVIHFAWNPEIVDGRYLFFGLHPNLGGELLLCCAIIIIFASSRVLRWFLSMLIFVLLLLLQSRAALLGTALVVMLGEVLRFLSISDRSTRYQLTILILSVVGISFLMLILFDSSLISRFGNFVYSDVLLLDHGYRGVGTGWVGREDTWSVALSAYAENPFFGVGLDRVGSEDDLEVHGGYLALIAQFGIFSLGFFLILGLGLIESFRQRSFRFAVIIACMFVFTLNARSVNLNAFPLILWLACLPWANRPQDASPRSVEQLASI